MIQKINRFITGVCDIILYPFDLIGDFFGILFLSALTSLVVLLGYKYFSSPKRIRRAKDQIKASIFAIRIYKDFWKVIVSSFFKSLFYVFKYFALNLATIIIILPILIPIFVQLDVRYGMRPFQSGEEIVIKASFQENPFDLDIKLLESDHFKPTMNPVFINAYKDDENEVPMREVNWKTAATGPGEAKIKIKVGETIFEKSLLIGNHKGALSNKKYRDSSWAHVIYPVELRFKEQGDLEYIYIDYPGKSVSFLGIRTHWLVYYLILVLIMVLALRRRFNVEF